MGKDCLGGKKVHLSPSPFSPSGPRLFDLFVYSTKDRKGWQKVRENRELFEIRLGLGLKMEEIRAKIVRNTRVIREEEKLLLLENT